MATTVQASETNDAQFDDDQTNAAGRRRRRPSRRHHSLPRQLIRAFEASPARGHVQSGLASRMEPFEPGRAPPPPPPPSATDAEEATRTRSYGAWRSSNLDLSSRDSQELDAEPHRRQRAEAAGLHRAIYGADIPEPLSSYERHVRSTIERHRRRASRSSNGDGWTQSQPHLQPELEQHQQEQQQQQQEGEQQQRWRRPYQHPALRRYATLADLSDLEAAAAEVERRLNNDDNNVDGDESPRLELRSWSFQPRKQQQPPPPPPPPRPRWTKKSDPVFEPPQPPQPKPRPKPKPKPRPKPSHSYYSLTRQRFSALDSFEAMKRAIEHQSATAEAAAAATDAETMAAFERTRWLIEAATGSNQPLPPPPPPPPQPSLTLQTLLKQQQQQQQPPPPVPLRRNRGRLVTDSHRGQSAAVTAAPSITARWSMGPDPAHYRNGYGHGNGHGYKNAFGYEYFNSGNNGRNDGRVHYWPSTIRRDSRGGASVVSGQLERESVV